MKGRSTLINLLALGLLLALVVSLALAQGPGPERGAGIQAGLGTAFTYQGRLIDGDCPAEGDYDLRFTLYDAEAGGSQVGSAVNREDLPVIEGRFTAALDFGAAAFGGEARWLEIGVRPGDSTGGFTTLVPRQALTAAPYALYARDAPWSGLAGVPAGFADGLDDDELGGLSCSNGQVAKWNSTLSQWQCADDQTGTGGSFWSLTGNAGTTASNFLGTTDNQALELRVNNARALRLEPNATSPNVIGGYSGNSVAGGVMGATIGGGGSGGYINQVTGEYGTIGGGYGNTASGEIPTIGGGLGNTASGDGYATVGGGYNNAANGVSATVAGGEDNTAIDFGAIGGGLGNSAGLGATVGGGSLNTASGQSAAIGGGQSNDASGNYAAIGGGLDHEASGYAATIGGGENITVTAEYATVGGGVDNTASYPHATISGGTGNDASGYAATIGGGMGNTASGEIPTIGGGYGNTASGDGYATVGGGYNNAANGVSATVAGGQDNTAIDFGTVGGGHDNSAGLGAAVGGGSLNTASGQSAAIGGGDSNDASGSYAAIPGGYHNTATGDYSFAAGRSAQATHQGSFVLADSTDEDFASVRNDALRVRFNGGATFVVNDGYWVRFWSSSGHLIDTSPGAYLSTGGTWTNASDRESKDNFSPVDGNDLLARLAEVPIQTWNYKAEDPTVRHLGPVAQDFHAAFGLGDDDQHISTIDAEGVALAAIQALHQRNQELEAENAAQQAQLADLEARLAALEQAVQSNDAPLRFAPGWLFGGLLLAGLVLGGRWRWGGGRP